MRLVNRRSAIFDSFSVCFFGKRHKRGGKCKMQDATCKIGVYRGVCTVQRRGAHCASVKRILPKHGRPMVAPTGLCDAENLGFIGVFAQASCGRGWRPRQPEKPSPSRLRRATSPTGEASSRASHRRGRRPRLPDTLGFIGDFTASEGFPLRGRCRRRLAAGDG